MSSTTLKISKETLSKLDELKKKSGARSLEQIVITLLKENRGRVLDKIFGADKGRLTSFREEDRGEDRS